MKSMYSLVLIVLSSITAFASVSKDCEKQVAQDLKSLSTNIEDNYESKVVHEDKQQPKLVADISYQEFCKPFWDAGTVCIYTPPVHF